MSRDFAFIPVHPGTLLGEEELESIVRDYADALEMIGGARRTTEILPTDRAPIYLLVVTGGSERVILEWWSQREKSFADEPLWLIAHSGNNSLPAALEVLARLQQDGAQGRVFYLSGPEDEHGLKAIAEAAHDVEVRRSLHAARIGLVGAPSDWLVASMPDASTIRATWGPTVVAIDMEEVVDAIGAVADEDLEAHLSSFIDHATEVLEPTFSDLREATRLYLVLKKVVTDHRLDALTVRCFDFVQHQRSTGCLGLAQLTDEGVIAGCEGDLVSTIGLLWAHRLLGVTPWMANPVQLEPGSNTLWMAHCTVPRTLVERYRLRSHFESGLGVGIQGTLPAGPVSLLRIGGKKLNRLWLAEGEMLRSGDAENLCRTQAEIQLTSGGNVTDLLRAPLGNHLVLVPGHHLDRLQSWMGTGVSGQA
jgi:L-fucose isomerase-like protein